MHNYEDYEDWLLRDILETSLRCHAMSLPESARDKIDLIAREAMGNLKRPLPSNKRLAVCHLDAVLRNAMEHCAS